MLLLATLSVLFLLSGCTKFVDESPPEKFFECSAYSDCKVVEGWGCGGCKIAINKNYENEYTQFKAMKTCNMILEMSPCPLIEENAAACVNSRCQPIFHVSWDEAVRILNGGQVVSASQTHNLDVWFLLKDGRQIKAKEPAIDDILDEITKCGDLCKGIDYATE